MQLQPGQSHRQTRTLAMTPALRRAIGLLRLSNAEVAAQLEAALAGHPALHLPRAEAALALFPPEGESRRPARPTALGGVEGALLAEAPEGLHAHLVRECRLLLHKAEDIRLAEALAGSVDPTGWLTRPLAEIAAEWEVSAERLEQVLLKVQDVSPAGMFARSLAECLRLQARDRGALTPVFEAVLANLPLLAEGRLDALSRIADASREEIAGIFSTIRSFDPKPGARFDASPAPALEPDLLLRRAPGGWSVELNRSTLPAIIVGVGEAGREIEAWQKALERRNGTLVAVAAEVVRRQVGWLSGAQDPLPMTFAGLAEKLDMHETTVGRAVAERMIATPRGTVLLRDMFRRSVGGEDGEAISAAAVRRRLKALIDGESPGAARSDADLARALAAEGIPLARRTVGKYREMMGVPPAHARTGGADRTRGA